jgi:hypothetical protein
MGAMIAIDMIEVGLGALGVRLVRSHEGIENA